MPHCTTGSPGDCSRWSPALRPLLASSASRPMSLACQTLETSILGEAPRSCGWIRLFVCAGWRLAAKCCRPVRVFRLGFELPLVECLSVIAASAGLNLWLRAKYPVVHRVERKRGDRASRLRHPATRRAALPDRRPGEPVRDAASRPRMISAARCRRRGPSCWACWRSARPRSWLFAHRPAALGSGPRIQLSSP